MKTFKHASLILSASLLFLIGCATNTPQKDTFDLGTVWQETEAGWQGKWIRRGKSSVFDARWTDGRGNEIRDEIVFEGVNDGIITLYRKGTNARYKGHVSADGKTITDGTAPWFPAGEHWQAVVIP